MADVLSIKAVFNVMKTHSYSLTNVDCRISFYVFGVTFNSLE